MDKYIQASLFVVGLLIMTSCVEPEQLNQNLATEEVWQFESLDGNEIMPFNDPNVKAIVLVFIATDCPIANAYQPELAKIHQIYLKQGVQLLLIHPARDIDGETAKKHASEFQIEIPIVLDRELRIARRVHAEVTPEAIVIQRGVPSPVYRGAIDDQYVDYGKKRPVPGQRYLVNAIEDILANRPVSHPLTKPIGCFISYDEL